MSRVDSDEDFISNLMSVDESLRNIILKAAALKIEDRYGSAAEMLNDLRNGFVASLHIAEEKQDGNVSLQNESCSSELNQYTTEPNVNETVPEANIYGETVVSKNNP